jgi:hypothetical protein
MSRRLTLESDRFVGQVGNLPPIVNRPCARPAKFLRRSHQPSLDRIRFDITNNPPKLGLVANQSIIALVLPELTSSKAQYPIAFPGSRPLKRLHDHRDLQQRSNQKMHMVRHHDESMQMETSQISISNRFHRYIGNLRLLEKKRASATVVKNAIHGDKCLSRVGYGRDTSISRQTSVQSPRDENRLPNCMIMWQPTPMKCSHKENVYILKNPLTAYVGRVGNLPALEKRPASTPNSSQADFQSAAGYQPALQKDWMFSFVLK